VLEPSCGEASFLLAAGERPTALRGSAPSQAQLAGVELHERSAEQALALLEQPDLPAAVTTGDFFHFPPRAPQPPPARACRQRRRPVIGRQPDMRSGAGAGAVDLGRTAPKQSFIKTPGPGRSSAETGSRLLLECWLVALLAISALCRASPGLLAAIGITLLGAGIALTAVSP